VILSIATKPSQFESILAWSKLIASERIVPFLSVHPEDSRARENITRAKDEGFIGMKFHPYYQGFTLDAESMFPIYEALQENGLICVCHTGFDHAYSFTRTADPRRIVNVVRRFPGLKFIATHLGAWRDWDSVAELLPGERLYVDISYSLEFLPPDKARTLITAFPRDRVLYGSDSPWGDQAESLALLRKLDLDESLERAIIRDNAARLLGR
jgi:predicted TIM-barrel fold metal-dependent hydrolase